MNYQEMSNEQRRQLIDAQQAFAAWRPTAVDLDQLGTMRVQSSKNNNYMYEVHGTVRKSLGRVTPKLTRQKAAHDERRKELMSRKRTLDNRLKAMSPVNRALGLGRLPTIAARIVRAIDAEGLLGSHVIVAGTNALYAYEAASGLIINQEHVATTDADLLWDNSQSLLLAATGIRRAGLMGLLRQVDRSFQADYGFNASNRDGYIVDLLCPETDDHLTMNAGTDLEAVPMPGAEWLLKAPRFEQVIVGGDGLPLRIVVPEPRTFALHKLWVSQREDRQPLKRPRDLAHARVVRDLVTTYLNQKIVAKDMPWLSKDLRAMIAQIKRA